MNIVILDKLDFPELYLERLRHLGNVTVYDDYPDEKTTLNRLADAEIAILGWTPLKSAILNQLPKLKCIALALTGYDIIDVEAAHNRNIVVCNVPGYSRQSVAEYAFALALAAIRHIQEADSEARGGNVTSPTESMLGHELYSKTLGVLGLGSIGTWMATIGKGFGMQVIGSSRSAKNLPDIRDVPLNELLRESDILMIAVDINPSTVDLLTGERLQNMKHGAVLINITSNRVLDEKAVVRMLQNGHLLAAGFDNLSDSAREGSTSVTAVLSSLPNVISSPQAGWYTEEAQQRLLRIAVDNVENFISGALSNTV